MGEHPLFNGKNGTPLIKFDGSKGCKNFVVDDGHMAVVYEYGEKEMFATFGTTEVHREKDAELFKQRNFVCYSIDFKSLKQIKMCEGPSAIYAQGHAILA